MSEISTWLQTSLRRVFPSSPAQPPRDFSILAARGERISFQACVRNPGDLPTDVSLLAECADLPVHVRRVGYVPMAHHNTGTEEAELDGVGHIPGFVPDPLFPESTVTVGPFETHAFWITVDIPTDSAPGEHVIRLKYFIGGECISELTASVHVRALIVRFPGDFPVYHWFYADALCDWYHVEPYEERFWHVARPYMQNVVEHGSAMYVPIFTPPTDGIKRPHQLIRITETSPGRYSFDFSDVRRWVSLAREVGARRFQWTHFFWQWGVKYALRIYRSNQDPESLLWPFETPATSDVYRNFLTQFLPEFHRFLQEESLLDSSIFHVSDEPHAEHIENYRAARTMLRKLAPWMKVADALSDIQFGLQGLTDMPIPVISSAKAYREAGIPAMTYFCCGPRGRWLNRLMDTPLAKIRMSGWLFYRLEAKGFLHWGYNYWYKSQTQQLIDPFTEQSGAAWPGWAYGDTFVVYPGADGPLDSIRWEIFAESLRDYALLEAAGVSPDDPLLGDIKDYDDFPKTEEWIRETRTRILETA